MIAADGTNSRVVQKLGFNNERRHITNLFVKSFFVSGFKAPVDGEPIVTGVNIYPGQAGISVRRAAACGRRLEPALPDA